MYNLKGFYSFPTLVNNAPDQVAKFGELSDNSKTYAKDKTYYSGQSTPDTILIAFHSVRDEVAVSVKGLYSDWCLKVGQYIYAQAVAGTITNDPAVLRQMVMAEFADVLTSFDSGAILDDGNHKMPEWVELVFNNPTAAELNRVNLWLVDESFAAQYDEYFIEIVHPIIPFNDFFKDPLAVRESLRAYDMVEKLEEVQAKRAQYPYTFQQAFRFDYHNPQDATFTEPAYWIALIYGQAGNNPDIIKDEIAKELIAGSTHVREDWEVILPDLFLTTEFIFTPFWHQYSAPQRDFRAGIYSPIMDPRLLLPLVKAAVNGPGYSPVWIEAKYELASNIYKSLAFASVGNPQNREGITQFSQKFPDYMLVTNDSDDFNRMDPVTREWYALFSRLIVIAETMDRYSSVPVGIARMVRNGVIYATAFFKNVNYMVVTKHSVEALI
jgi:hypothetical protein